MHPWTKYSVRLFVRAISFCSWLTPRGVRWGVGVFLAWLWFDVFRIRRYTLLRNLTIAFPEWSPEKRYEVARRSLVYMCYGFPEFLTLPQLSKNDFGKNIFFHGRENYEKALSQNKGVFILTLHLGNGDVGASSLVMSGIVAHLITKKFSNPIANEIWFGIRGSQGTQFIDAHGSRNSFQILAAARKNEGIIFVLDQFMGRPYGIETLFFGRKTGTAYGLAMFAGRTGTPVVPVYTYRDEKLNTHVTFEPEIPLIEMEDRDLQIQTMTQKYNDKIEEIVRQHPEQWMWIHRRWKKWK